MEIIYKAKGRSQTRMDDSKVTEVTFATNSAVFLQAPHAQLRKTGSEKFPLKGRIMASQTDRSIKPRNAKNQLCQMV